MPSKRTISDSSLQDFVLHLVAGNAPTTYADAGRELISHFDAYGLDPFTRKDWDLVLAAYADQTGNIEIPGVVKVANKTFERLSKGLTRPKWGYYSSQAATQAPVTAPEPAQAPAATPAPPVASVDELEAAMDALATDEPVNTVPSQKTEAETGEGPDLDALLDAAQEAHEDDLAMAFSQGLDKPPAPKPLVIVEAGVTWVPPGLDHKSHPLYVEDEGLRRLAVSQTRCFGNYSDRAKACKSCPLVGFCAVASMTGLGDIEAALNRETEEAIAIEAARAEAEAKRLARANEPTPEPESTPAENEPETSNETPEGLDLPDGASLIQPPFGSKCSKCSEMVPAWSTAVHLPGEGLVHAACANK